MAKRKKAKKKNAPHPTMFVFNGGVQHYPDGSMLELHTGVTDDEWIQIVEETVKYRVFVECLKQVAFPILLEKWTKLDEWYRVQMEVAVSRMRNIDPLRVAQFNTDELKDRYIAQMQTNAHEFMQLAKSMRQQITEPEELRVTNL